MVSGAWLWKSAGRRRGTRGSTRNKAPEMWSSGVLVEDVGGYHYTWPAHNNGGTPNDAMHCTGVCCGVPPSSPAAVALVGKSSPR